MIAVGDIVRIRMISRWSIHGLLGSMFAVLAGVAILLAAGGVVQSSGDWRKARQVVTLSETSQSVFAALQAGGQEQGAFAAALVADVPAEDGLRSRIAQARAQGARALAAALAEGRGLDLPGLAEALAGVDDAALALERLRTAADTAIAKRKADRDPTAIAQFVKAQETYVAALRAVDAVMEAGLASAGSRLGLLLSVKRDALGARGRAALVAQRLEQAAAAARSWTDEDKLGYAGDNGGLVYAWADLGKLAGPNQLPPVVASAITAAGGYFSGPQAKERLGLIKILSENDVLFMPMPQLQKRNGAELQLFVDVAEAAGDAMIAVARDASRTALLWLGVNAAIAVVALVVGVVGLVVVRHRVSGPLQNLSETMTRLAHHDLAVAIPGLGRGDEIGAMAQAVQTFKDQASLADRLAQEKQAAQERQNQRAQALETMTTGFEATVSGALGVVSDAASRLQGTARAMRGNADHTDAQASAVATATADASSGVETVAASAEELSASIAEIARQVAQATDTSRTATEEAGEADRVIQGLAATSARIGDVVKLINTIASQTNLLALNATIEAARAGEAGKGFAVVAGEVKVLATQTAKATDEIAGQIGAIQGATQTAVRAIGGVVGRIGEINAISSAIAAAVEEQAAATAEIARNVETAAHGTRQVAAGIGGVSQAATQTGQAAEQVLDAAAGLTRQAHDLHAVVHDFLHRVKTA